MVKVLFTIIALAVTYLLGVFLTPDFTSKIESSIGLSGTTDSIRNFKDGLDEIATDIPSANEFKSGAFDIGNTVRGWLDSTKQKIDDVRVTLSGAKDTIDSTFDTFDTAVDTVKSARDTVEKLKNSDEALWELWESLKWSVNTSDVGSATEN